MSTIRPVVLAAVLAAFGSSAIAQELVYTPRNPTFGGDPFNSAHLLSTAAVHRPDPPSENLFDDNELSQAELFAKQLESRILTELAQQITEAIFGESPQDSGVYSFDTTTVAFETLLDGTIRVAITDNASGGTTVIDIPSP